MDQVAHRQHGADRVTEDVVDIDEGRLALQQGIGEFIVFHEIERMRLYRISLQLAITEWSSLARDLLATTGVCVDNVARRLPLPERFPWQCKPGPLAGAGGKWSSFGHFPPHRAFSRRVFGGQLSAGFGRNGVIMRQSSPETGALGFLVWRGGLEAVASLGEAALYMERGVARLHLPHAIPEVVATSAPGRAVDEIVDHHILRGRGYPWIQARKG